jgi:hypothetical protein
MAIQRKRATARLPYVFLRGLGFILSLVSFAVLLAIWIDPSKTRPTNSDEAVLNSYGLLPFLLAETTVVRSLHSTGAMSN